MLQKVISGGQTGADIAGLQVASEFGLETGGCMPKGFLTQNGPRPEYAKLYNIREHSNPKYPPRTAENVRDSDGTVRFAINFNSPGEILTLKMIHQYQRPYFDVNPIDETITPQQLADWIVTNNIQTLNVAGNSDRTAPGIGDFVVAFLHATFECLS